MQATDPDCGVNAMVNYTLAAGRVESEQLMVRSDTGDICVRAPLDRETAPYLEIPVIATDRGMYLLNCLILGSVQPLISLHVMRRQKRLEGPMRVARVRSKSSSEEMLFRPRS